VSCQLYFRAGNWSQGGGGDITKKNTSSSLHENSEKCTFRNPFLALFSGYGNTHLKHQLIICINNCHPVYQINLHKSGKQIYLSAIWLVFQAQNNQFVCYVPAILFCCFSSKFIKRLS
jgi:hypothetical protein